VDAPATPEQKILLKTLRPDQVAIAQLGGEPVLAVETSAPGGGALGGVRVRAKNGWFAARPSGTEDVYKIYAESFIDFEHLQNIQREAQALVSGLFQAPSEEQP
jgi:phosphoglucomutase